MREGLWWEWALNFFGGGLICLAAFTIGWSSSESELEELSSSSSSLSPNRFRFLDRIFFGVLGDFEWPLLSREDFVDLLDLLVRGDFVDLLDREGDSRFTLRWTKGAEESDEEWLRGEWRCVRLSWLMGTSSSEEESSSELDESDMVPSKWVKDVFCRSQEVFGKI